MSYRYTTLAVTAILALAPAAPVGPLDAAQPAAAANPAATVIATYRARIPELMAEEDVPGLAVALVDAKQTLWVEGFGRTGGRDSVPVTGDTIFSVQSMSKLFTATAVMQAVAAGRLDLDAPITTYLPGFTVHSAFEQHPERKITLRMLLGHTAGFTHEAPVGNNDERDPGSFDAHVRSISDTWLRFPVGSGYAYSNLGIDLAGSILQHVEGKPFPEVMRDSLLEPLGMTRSSFDRTEIRAADDRAVGRVHPYPEPPLDVPMTAAGGLYTSAADLARLLRFELNSGSLDGRVVLDPNRLAEMQTVPPPRAGAPAGYALGVARHRWDGWPDVLEHGGGGYGFLSDLRWLPEVGVGIAVLTNADDHRLQTELAQSILTDLLREPGVFRGRLLTLPWRPPAADPDGLFVPPAALANLVAGTAGTATGDEAARWAAYSGAYRRPIWDYLDPSAPADRFTLDGGVPYFEARDPETESLVRHRLAEVEPGLFLADNGETLDFRGQVRTWRNLRLVRVSGGPSSRQWAMLGAAALVALAWLVGALARTVRRVLGSRSSSAVPRTGARRWRRVAALVASATALLTLLTVGILVSLPGLVDAGFQSWLDLSPTEWLVLYLPAAVALSGASTAVLAASGWIGHWWSRAVTLQYAALAGASVALVSLLAGWHLIA